MQQNDFKVIPILYKDKEPRKYSFHQENSNFVDALLYDIDVKAEINFKNSKVLGNGPDI